MTIRHFAPLLLSLLVAGAAAADEPKLVESIEVRVTNVDVVVTDHAGKPVTGLTKADFEIFENKKPQTITNFYEVRPEKAAIEVNSAAPETEAPAPEPPRELRRRRYLLFIDNFSISLAARNQVFGALEKFIDGNFREGDQAMIVSWARSLKIVTPFTSDREEIRRGIHELAKWNAGAATLEWERNDTKRNIETMLNSALNPRNRGRASRSIESELESLVRSYAENTAGAELSLIDSAELMLSTLAGLEGKKVMIFAGGHLPERPGLDLYQWLQQLLLARGVPTTIMPYGNASQQRIEGKLTGLAESANAAAVTMYTIDTLPIGGTTAEADELPDPQEEFFRFTNTAQALQKLADLTGGVAISNTSNFNAAFDTIARDLDAYYSLGYSPAAEGTGNRNLVVRCKNPAYTVRSRRGYVQKSSSEQMKDRVLANVFLDAGKSELPIRLRTGAPQQKGRNQYQVPLEVEIPSTVTLLPDGDQLVGGVTVYIVVGTKEGALSPVTEAPRSIKIPASAEKELRSKPLYFTAAMLMAGGPQVLSVAVVDQLSHASGFARVNVLAK